MERVIRTNMSNQTDRDRTTRLKLPFRDIPAAMPKMDNPKSTTSRRSPTDTTRRSGRWWLPNIMTRLANVSQPPKPRLWLMGSELRVSLKGITLDVVLVSRILVEAGKVDYPPTYFREQES